MKTGYYVFPALLVSAIVLAACAQTPAQPPAPTLPKDVPGATQPFTSEAAGKPGLSVYQVNQDGSSQEVAVPGLTQQEDNSIAVPATKGMVITKEGFNPSTLTFKVGTKLIIQNSDSANHQPMSDPHPAHTDCPELNSAKPLALGEFYEVTITSAKTCGIHDHLNPELKAAITVTE